ncbi:MAG TPA: transcription-repair coupling factor [Firmicutes bacterium]|jgi:transcription-repair coupling factor (superfamily II helicase)|nr:transcription-repair coupling factor [Bacillota bacterium]HOQ23467.1 transcription-repair coupling factor [Bacillota bacterium]HPT67875.1 transcription-repair coupling factor [Bacillota bacterium]
MLEWVEEQIRACPEWENILLNKSPKDKATTIIGLNGGQKAAVLAALWRQAKEHLLVITFSPRQAEVLLRDLEVWVGKANLLYFPAYELLPHEEAYEREIAGVRLRTAERVLAEERKLVITSWAALERKMLPPELLVSRVIEITLGQAVERNFLLNALVMLGYERVELVENPGEFSVRGDIVDLFAPACDLPVRIEFFGDEVDSIREFDPQTQCSCEQISRYTIYPAREGIWTEEEFRRAEPAIRESLAHQVSALKGQESEGEALQLKARMEELLHRLASNTPFPGSDRFIPLIHQELASFLDYLPTAHVILDEPVRGEEYYRQRALENAKTLSSSLDRGLILPQEQAGLFTAEELIPLVYQQAIIHLSVLTHSVKRSRANITLPLRPVEGFAGKSREFLDVLRRHHKERVVVGLLVYGQERREHLRRSLAEAEIPAVLGPVGGAPAPGTVYIMEGTLESGFIYPQGKLAIYTEAEIFGQARRPKRVRFSSEGVKLTAFSDLKPGDYVVHINHGIGRYVNIKTLEIAGVHRDYLEVAYAGDDRLFVPVDQMQLLQKYVGVEDEPPKVHRLGGGDWQRVKNRVKESVQEMAEGLLALYAERQSLPGHAFAPDTVWQKEFEEAFVYEETPDQLKAIKEIKEDMERPRPMDRLLCGDVGYGKTEVAMRAAFKAVMDGKQVAVLVPTTILCQQHYQTFSQRFSGYPVTIRAMSRFQSPKEQEETKLGLAEGWVDLVIGTHRLISRDIVFKDLGLLIIDEEQRFGVSHKERLKELSKRVDVLTMTATPIPRTLHMSMVGIRDMSIIDTPPEDRFSVRTYVLEFNEEIIREAIRREMDRGGQVYFVYNRVETIDRMAAYLQNLVPEARILVGHGQMSEEQLERIMFDFYQGEADILVCTTIIETGLDIPNVNTLVVYDADRFGLAQLYQLRGRVGRSNRVAHAYFTYRKDRIIGEVAEKRLAAIRDFTDLGSGFKIAMRDLEIRGAGNLLGPEQHGHIAAVGFELYCKLLEEAIRERKGEQQPETPEPAIDLPVDALLPEDYINDIKQRVEIYRWTAAATSLEGIEALEDEVLDRFGNLPAPVENLFAVAKIKFMAKAIGIASLTQERQEIVARMFPGLSLAAEKVLPIIGKYPGAFRYQPGRTSVLRWRMTGLSQAMLLKRILECLQTLAG